MKVRRRRGVIALGSYELDVGALTQVLSRPGCWLTPLILLLLLVLVGVTRPWELLRGRGTVTVKAPENATWTIGGMSGRGSATVPVRGGRQELRAGGEVYFPRTVAVDVVNDLTTTVVLTDGLTWLTAAYTDAVLLLWPQPTLYNLPANVRRLAFTGRERDLVYEAKEQYGGDWRAYVLASDGQVRRLAWVEALGEQWSLAPDGRAAYSRGGQLAIATDVVHSEVVYSTTLKVRTIQRMVGGWVAVLDEGFGQGRQVVWLKDNGQVQAAASLGREVEVVGQVGENLLVRFADTLHLLQRGEVFYLGDIWRGEFPGVYVAGDGYIYWTSLDLSTEAAAGKKKQELRAVWRAALPTADTVPVATQVTMGEDVAGILSVREGQLYYVVVQKGELQLAHRKTNGAGASAVLQALAISGTEIWPGPDLQRWVIYDQISDRLWVADFGGQK